MKNYQAKVCRYQPKAELDNDKLSQLVNFSYHVKTEFGIIIVLLFI